MNSTRAVTLHLDPTDFDRLTAEAERWGLSPSALIERYVRAGLNPGETLDERNRRAGLDALDRLKALRASLHESGYPPIDAAELVRQAREELEPRISK